MPVSKLPELVYETKKDLAEAGLRSTIVGHVGDGNFHALLIFHSDEELQIPEETEDHPYFESHELSAPLEETVTKRTAFGTHWGLVYFFGDDAYEMRTVLTRQEELDFYV